MQKRYPLDFKLKAQQLRLKGFSYLQIKKSLGVNSKGTISGWLKNLVLDDAAIKLIESKMLIYELKGLREFNQKRSKRVRDENNNAHWEGLFRLAYGTNSPLMLLGTALYWAEGTKSLQGRPSNPQFMFTNSDPTMISLFLRFMREELGVRENRIKASIHIYPDTNIEETRLFWSEHTKLPTTIFSIVTQISRSSSQKRKNLPHGTLTIKVNDRKLFYFIRGAIDGLYLAFSDIRA